MSTAGLPLSSCAVGHEADHSRYYAACQTESELTAMRKRLSMVDTVLEQKRNGRSLSDIADSVWLSTASLSRLMTLWAACEESGDPRMLLPGKSTGRTPICRPSANELRALRALYVRSNLSRGKGSKTMAARLFAQSPECSPELRDAILRRRSSKHSLPKSLRDAMTVSTELPKYHRSPNETRLGGMYCPGELRMAREDGEQRRLYAGERQSWDDASINFPVVVPWPWGGDRCSNKWGVKVGRFQLLAGIDDASDYCPGYSFVCRPLQSYRGEDSTGAMHRVWRDTYQPKFVMVEGGVWQSNRAMRFYEQVGVEPISAKGRPHMKLIESYWNRLWSILSLKANCQIGRYRGEMERENKLLMQCQAGTLDPREVFPSLTNAMAAIDDGIRFLNMTPVESKKYGSWVPAERHAEDLALHPRQALNSGLAWTVAPEIHTRKTYRGMVAVKVESPLGFPFPYHFAADDLNEYNGCMVTVYFDPWAYPVTAHIVLAEEHAGKKIGTVIATRAQCIDDAPSVIRTCDSWAIEFNPSGLHKAVDIRKAQARLLRTEYRALGIREGVHTQVETIIRSPETAHVRPQDAKTDATEHEESPQVIELPKILSRAALVAS